MSKSFSVVCALSALVLSTNLTHCHATKRSEVTLTVADKKVNRRSPTIKAAFTPFTGKVNGNRVRVRLHSDLESYVAKELNKGAYISILGQVGDFYRIAAPESVHAYIFRSFVLDGVVEGNRVNVRLSPDLEAPILGHLNTGDEVDGRISSINKKWLEISPPSHCGFYVAKEYIDYAGGPELKAKMDKRKESVGQLLEAANLLAESEIEKEFEEIDFERIKLGFITIINEYNDFPKEAQLAKSSFARIQEIYLQKRIAYLEEKAGLVSHFAGSSNQGTGHSYKKASLVHIWEQVEDALYSNWADLHNQRDKTAFYNDQKLVAVPLEGILEAYTSPVRNKPGDYIVKKKNVPVAYVYSTNVDLSQHVGKKVKLLGSTRSNNNFAFPAYFVHTVE